MKKTVFNCTLPGLSLPAEIGMYLERNRLKAVCNQRFHPLPEAFTDATHKQVETELQALAEAAPSQ